MMAPILLALPGNERMAMRLAEALQYEVGTLAIRRFPDRETYMRLHSDVAGQDVVLVCSLDDPDSKLAQILFAADLPKTRSGKIMRRLLRDIAEGKALGDTTTLADPAVVARLKEQYGDEH